MTIRYANGYLVEAVLLSRGENRLRVAPQGSEDVLELNLVNGTWVTDECEPVQVGFAWDRVAEAPAPEEDFICPPELAARLLRMLFHVEDSECADAPAAAPARASGLNSTPIV
jgi:hypothetical protein